MFFLLRLRHCISHGLLLSSKVFGFFVLINGLFFKLPEVVVEFISVFIIKRVDLFLLKNVDLLGLRLLTLFTNVVRRGRTTTFGWSFWRRFRFLRRRRRTGLYEHFLLWFWFFLFNILLLTLFLFRLMFFFLIFFSSLNFLLPYLFHVLFSLILFCLNCIELFSSDI